MKRTWLLFSQTATVLLAAYFVVATLKPAGLGRSNAPGVISVIEAPAGDPTRAAGEGFRRAVQKSSSAVVSINTSKAARKGSANGDPWCRTSTLEPT